MLTREFIINSEYRLRKEESGRIVLLSYGKEVQTEEAAIASTESMLYRFGIKYPNYGKMMMDEFHGFIK